jgi:hypothetical protein|tara:strand:+ start:10335 stop:10649 length:315 start_codon:yes stop_codon:yes gene_type:complete
MDTGKNPILDALVEPETHLKNMLIEYVGETLDPEDGNVTVEMISEVVAKEFPEFLLAIAEENWIRGYQQALQDAEEGEKVYREHLAMFDTDTGEHHDGSKTEIS